MEIPDNHVEQEGIEKGRPEARSSCGNSESDDDLPAAVRTAVNALALISALGAPVFSSRTRVDAGSPFAFISEEEVGEGTATTLMEVPKGARRAGMKSAVWEAVGTERRCGMASEGADVEVDEVVEG
jgi:hypothetical protein